MIDREKWAVGRKIKFYQSGLDGTGIIIDYSKPNVLLVLLDNECADRGWTITYECVEYEGQKGWWVNITNAKLLQTKLGNSL